MSRPVKLSVIRNERAAADAKELRRDLYTTLRNVVNDAGNGIAGYALVVWNKDGENWSTIKPGGPIQSRLLPTFVGDAITQHVAVDLTRNNR